MGCSYMTTFYVIVFEFHKMSIDTKQYCIENECNLGRMDSSHSLLGYNDKLIHHSTYANRHTLFLPYGIFIQI